MKKILMAHGSGGKISHDLIKDTFFKYFDNDILDREDDSAIVNVKGRRTAFTTDSFVVKPVFFIKLMVCFMTVLFYSTSPIVEIMLIATGMKQKIGWIKPGTFTPTAISYFGFF